MTLRFRKSFKLAPGVRLNVSGSGANYGQRHANLPVRRLSSRSQNSCPDFGRSLPLSSQTS
ncbi:DUF4236 domain-containing protein [Massilia sp. TN1-12]